MPHLKKLHFSWQSLLWGAGLFMVIGLTGCQVDVGGQTLPSAYYLQDDVQYFPTGPEMKLSREAATQKAAAAAAAVRQQ